MYLVYVIADFLDRVTSNGETALIGLLALTVPALVLYLLL